MTIIGKINGYWEGNINNVSKKIPKPDYFIEDKLERLRSLTPNSTPTYETGYIHYQMIKGKNWWQTKRMYDHFVEGLMTMENAYIWKAVYFDRKTRGVEYTIDTNKMRRFE